MNLLALEDGTKVDEKVQKTGGLSYAEFIKQNAHLEPAPVASTNRYLMKTPKVGTSRFIPRTASRADDLLKQMARKRLKTTLAESNSQESVLISAMSGLSCGSERRPKNTVNVFVDSPEKSAGGKLKTGKKKLFCKDSYSAEQETSPKKPARGAIASETPAAPKTTSKKRLITTASFRDALISDLDALLEIPLPYSTPKETTTTAKTTKITGRTTSKKPKPATEYPKLGRAKSKSPKQQNSPFNSSFRDVLLQSLTESSGKPAATAANSSVIVLDDSSSDEVINTSITENTSSVNRSSNGGVLSLKKYSDRKVYGSIRKKITAKTRLQFDTSVVDITTPDSSPVVKVVAAAVAAPSSAETGGKVAKRTRGRTKAVVKTTTTTTTTADVTPERTTTVATRTRTARKVRGKAGAV